MSQKKNGKKKQKSVRKPIVYNVTNVVIIVPPTGTPVAGETQPVAADDASSKVKGAFDGLSALIDKHGIAKVLSILVGLIGLVISVGVAFYLFKHLLS